MNMNMRVYLSLVTVVALFIVAPATQQSASANQKHKEVAMVGRMLLVDGLVAERTADNKIKIGLTHGGDPNSEHTRVVWFEFTEEQFASMVAHASRRGETTESYYETIALIQKAQ